MFHSCRNRHCPQCQTRAKEAWTAARLTELLPVPYAHMVFTVPHALNALAGAHPRWIYQTLLSCVAQTLSEFAANPRWLGARIAITLVLHTWTQDLRRHLHVHALVSCGGVDDNGQWIAPRRKPQFLFPVHALSEVFRAKFLAAMDRARPRLNHDPQAARWSERRRALLAHGWVVYAKTPMGGPAQVLEYLSRYTHRTAISNERILGIQAGQVKLRVRADEHGAKRVISHPRGAVRPTLHAACAPPGIQTHPPLRAAGPGAQVRAAGTGAAGSGYAGGQPPGLRRRGRIPPTRNGYRGLVLPALRRGALANRAGIAARARRPRTGRS